MFTIPAFVSENISQSVTYLTPYPRCDIVDLLRHFRAVTSYIHMHQSLRILFRDRVWILFACLHRLVKIIVLGQY